MKILIALLFLVGCIGLILLSIKTHHLKPHMNTNTYAQYVFKPVHIGSHTYSIFIADTEQKRVLGLSGATYLHPNDGLGFIFEKPDTYGFWMKDMNFPLDIIYVHEMKVVEIFENVSPSTYPKVFTPSKPANVVIELSAGEVKHNGIKIGDEIKLK